MLKLFRYAVTLLVGVNSLLFASCINEATPPPVFKSAVIELYQSPDGELESKLPRKISLNDAEMLASLSDHFQDSSDNAVHPGGWVAAIVIKFDEGSGIRTISSNYEFWWEGKSNHRVKNPPFLRKLIEQLIQDDEQRPSEK